MPILIHELFFKTLSNRGLFGINTFRSLEDNVLYLRIIYLIAPMWPKVLICFPECYCYNSNTILGPSGSLNWCVILHYVALSGPIDLYRHTHTFQDQSEWFYSSMDSVHIGLLKVFFPLSALATPLIHTPHPNTHLHHGFKHSFQNLKAGHWSDGWQNSL